MTSDADEWYTDTTTVGVSKNAEKIKPGTTKLNGSSRGADTNIWHTII